MGFRAPEHPIWSETLSATLNSLAGLLIRWGYLCAPLTRKYKISIAESSPVNDLQVNGLKILDGLKNEIIRKVIETNLEDEEMIEVFPATPT